MKDHDFDIQIFDHSTRKEGGTVPLLLILVTERKGFAFTRLRGNRPSGSDLCRDRELQHT